MVLSLPNGEVFFFQAGTEELVNEWVSTCNYWAARVSKEPLAGGVSNMEYGWNRIADPFIQGRATSYNDTRDSTDTADAMSIRSGRSTRSSRYKLAWRDGVATVRGSSSPYVDKTFIADWKEPYPPAVSSKHDEETQLEALKKHVAFLKKDLQQHNDLRNPMMNLVKHTLPFPNLSAEVNISVSTQISECTKGPDKLGEEVEIYSQGDCQIRVIHRFSNWSYVFATQETGRKRSVVHSSRPFDAC